MAFLTDLTGFYGTGEKNRAGQSLEEFLAAYNPKKYDCPSNTTDIVVVRCREELRRWGQPVKVLLVRRSNHPSIGCLALPGGFVELREDLETGAARELAEETGVRGLPLKQLRTWGSWQRDPRWRVITTSFLALVEGDIPVKAGDDAADALWMNAELKREPAGEKEEVWSLKMENQQKGVKASAKVGISRIGCGLLKEESYHLLSCDGLAVDHGCIIVHALLELKKMLKSREKA